MSVLRSLTTRMRVALAAAAVLLAAGGAIALATGVWTRLPGISFFGVHPAEPGRYRVDAIFDSARGIIPGQVVKVAGVRVGLVSDVELTPDYKARIEMQVDGRYAPFRTDARCEIRPEGLTAENFVQCDPGTPRGRVLRGHRGARPTVPVSRTGLPVNLTGLFDIWTLPVRERFRVLVNELGLGFAARGDDFNAIVARTNPALARARRVIATLRRQRVDLATLIRGTDRIVAALARRRGRVTDFARRAAAVSRTTAAHAGPLGRAVKELPAALRAAAPALPRVRQFALDVRPTVRGLRVAAPQLNASLDELGPFVREARPVLRGLTATQRRALPAVRRGRPLVAGLRRLSPRVRRSAPLIDALFTNLRDSGAVEHILASFYYLAAATARFDGVSHILPAHIIANGCSMYARTPVAGCSAHLDGRPPARARRRAGGADRGRVPPSTPRPRPAPARDRRVGPARPGAPPPPGQSPPGPPGVPAPVPAAPGLETLDDILDFLLR